MIFAVICSVLALGVAWWMVRPLIAADGAIPAPAADPATQYRRALAALGTDESNRLISPDAAQAERVALARELLQSDAPAPVPTPGPPHKVRGLAFALLAAVPLLGGGIYVLAGGNLRLANAGHTTLPPQIAELEGIARHLSERVAKQPDDAEGYRALGLALALLQRYGEAAEAYRTAVALGSKAPETLAALGETLTIAQGGISSEAMDAFDTALKEYPDEPTALLFRGQGRYEMGNLQGAREDWARLLAKAPQDAPWRERLAEHLAELDREIAAVPAVPQGGEGIAALDPAARQAAIEGMVAQLAARLEAAPDDIEGWIKLIRSYTVLGEAEKAQTARARAQVIFKDDAAALKALAP